MPLRAQSWGGLGGRELRDCRDYTLMAALILQLTVATVREARLVLLNFSRRTLWVGVDVDAAFSQGLNKSVTTYENDLLEIKYAIHGIAHYIH